MDLEKLMPRLSGLDVALEMIAVVIYVSIAGAALAHAPRDERTRVFGALALLNAAGALVAIGFWWLGIHDPQTGRRIPLAVMLAMLATASLALFHFSQVFPRRRPWIRTAGPQLAVAYVLIPLIVLLVVPLAPPKNGSPTAAFVLLTIAFGFPLLVLNGVVLPIATIVGFARSLREAATARQGPDARPVLAACLISLVAGTAVVIFVVGPLHAVAPASPLTAFAAIAAWMLGLLMPAAYAAAIWRYRLLDVPSDDQL